MLIDFIHSLPVPTSIINFKREFVEVNALSLEIGKVDTMTDLQTTTTIDYFFDEKTLNALEEEIFLNKKISNRLVAMRYLNGDLTFRILNCSILSSVDQLIIVQQIISSHVDDFISRKFSELLLSIRKLKPYLNREGKMLLEDLYTSNMQILQNDIFHVSLETQIKQLIQYFPVLTTTELYICAYIVIGFSTKEISAITGLSRNALRVHIHNICNRLKISTRDELLELLKPYNPTQVLHF